MEHEIRALAAAIQRKQAEQGQLIHDVLQAVLDSSRSQDVFLNRLQQIMAAYDPEPQPPPSNMAQRFAPQSYVPQPSFGQGEVSSVFAEPTFPAQPAPGGYGWPPQQH